MLYLKPMVFATMWVVFTQVTNRRNSGKVESEINEKFVNKAGS